MASSPLARALSSAGSEINEELDFPDMPTGSRLAHRIEIVDETENAAPLVFDVAYSYNLVAVGEPIRAFLPECLGPDDRFT